MNADEDGFVNDDGVAVFIEFSDIAFAQCKVRLDFGNAVVCDELEFAVVGRQKNGLDAFDLAFALQAVLDEFCDCRYFEFVFFAEIEQLRDACH